MNASVHRQLARRKRRIPRRIENQPGVERHQPMMAASNIHYEIADRIRAIAPGGIGAIHLLARKLGLIDDIDRNLHLLKRHQPYYESDHVLNIAYNLLAGAAGWNTSKCVATTRSTSMPWGPSASPTRPPPGTSAAASPRPMSSGLMDIFNETRLRVWKQQPADFFDEAFLDADGTLAPSGGCVQAGRGHLLQRRLGLSSAGRLAGQHRRAAVPGQPQRQPALARAGRHLLR